MGSPGGHAGTRSIPGPRSHLDERHACRARCAWPPSRRLPTFCRPPRQEVSSTVIAFLLVLESKNYPWERSCRAMGCERRVGEPRALRRGRNDPPVTSRWVISTAPHRASAPRTYRALHTRSCVVSQLRCILADDAQGICRQGARCGRHAFVPRSSGTGIATAACARRRVSGDHAPACDQPFGRMARAAGPTGLSPAHSPALRATTRSEDFWIFPDRRAASVESSRRFLAVAFENLGPSAKSRVEPTPARAGEDPQTVRGPACDCGPAAAKEIRESQKIIRGSDRAGRWVVSGG